MKIGRIFLVVAVSIVISQAIVRDLFAEVPAKQVAGEVRETDDGEIRRPVKPNWTQRHESVSANGSHSASLNGATFRLDPCEGGAGSPATAFGRFQETLPLRSLLTLMLGGNGVRWMSLENVKVK